MAQINVLPLQCHFTAPPLKEDSISPPVILSWPCDLLLKIEDDRSVNVPILSLGLERPNVIRFSFGTLPSHYVNELGWRPQEGEAR